MHDLDPTLSTTDAQAIEEFCRYELVTLTQLDAHRVKASFQDSFGGGRLHVCEQQGCLFLSQRQDEGEAPILRKSHVSKAREPVE